MNPDGREPGSDQETDDPVGVLMSQEHDTPADFLGKVRNRIHRRSATPQLVSNSWHVPKKVLVELASMLNHVFSAFSGSRRS
jgi:hypothetical protein